MLNARPQPLEDVPTAGVSRATSFPNKLIHADLYRISMNQMAHRDFASLFISFYPETLPGEFSRDEVLTSHGWMARYVLNFLDATLKSSADAQAFLTAQPSALGVPPHLLSPVVRKAQRPASTQESLARELARTGFAAIGPTYRAMREAEPTFELKEPELNAWGYYLIKQNRAGDAVAVLKFATDLYPTSGNLFDSLGEAYKASGDSRRAIESYRQSLRLDPTNANATEQLRQLGGGRS